MNKLVRTYYMAQAVGWDNLHRRAWQVFKTRLGISRWRLPGGELSSAQLHHQFVGEQPDQAERYWQARATGFFFSAAGRERLAKALSSIVDDSTWDNRVSRIEAQLRRGQMLFFSRFYADVGYPPQFNRDPMHQVDWPVGRHWSTYVQFDPQLRDLKCVWEASRFSWAFYLARQYVRKPAAATAELFWDLFDVWDEQNPYGLTPQWACGQESTFRLFAWLFCAIATLDAGAADARRLHRLTQRAWYTGRHIERNINYARSQKNNHAISEAIGLWTIGALFPELRRARPWRACGRKVLLAELARQVYEDGSYVQHSLNYHRVMLDDVLWAARLGELCGDPLPKRALECVERALHWLLEMIEPQTGRVPNYGPNDGAQVLPLSTCDYVDFRPVAQAVHYLLYRKRCFPAGPWDEKLLWLFGEEALSASVQAASRKTSFRADVGGYYALQGPQSWGLIRCHSYRDRPLQTDMLHFDLWYGRHNVLRDAGSYHYYCDQPWQSHFKSTAAHNTVELDGVDQMIGGPRFMWFRWTRSRLNRFETSPDGRVSYFEGEHYGYKRLPGRVVHRRAVCRLDDLYVVVDDVLGTGNHNVTLRWRLCDTCWEAGDSRWESTVDGLRVVLSLVAPDGFSTQLLRGQEEPAPEGWESLYYGEKQPVPVLRVSGRVELPARLVTLVTPVDSGVTAQTGAAGTPADPLRLAGLSDPELAAQINSLSGGRVQAV